MIDMSQKKKKKTKTKEKEKKELKLLRLPKIEDSMESWSTSPFEKRRTLGKNNMGLK